MDELFAHPKVILEVLIAYWLFSAFVTSMPPPEVGSFWYKWIYDLLHLFAGSVKKFADSKIQSLESSVSRKTPDGGEVVEKTTIKETGPAPDGKS